MNQAGSPWLGRSVTSGSARQISRRDSRGSSGIWPSPCKVGLQAESAGRRDGLPSEPQEEPTMRSARLPMIFILAALVLGTEAWAATATFNPPAQQGDIFAVVNANRSAGARVTSLTVDWGGYHRGVTRANP